MCGGGKKSTPAPAAPVNMGYSYAPADQSNSQRQVAAVAGKQPTTANYGSELGTAPATTGAN